MQKNTLSSYSPTSKFFHWTMSAMILTLIPVGFYMTGMDDSDLKWQIYGMHKSFGLLVLLLFPMRFTWKLLNTTPHLNMIPSWERHSAHALHWLLYLGMITMPLSGWIMATASNNVPNFFGLFEVAAPVAMNEQTASTALNIHYYSAWVLVGLLTLHLGAAIKAHWIDKNEILSRMMPGRNKTNIW